MTSKWFNMVLSLLKRQQHIKPFRGHSCHSSTFWLHSTIMKYVFFRMNQKWQTDSGVSKMRWEWLLNVRMRVKWGISKNSDFFHSEKTASFLPIRSFHCHLKMFRMTRNLNYNGEISLKIHCSHFEQIFHSRVRLEWRNEAKCGDIFEQRQNP